MRRRVRRENSSLPVAVHVSKTREHKLPTSGAGYDSLGNARKFCVSVHPSARRLSGWRWGGRKAFGNGSVRTKIAWQRCIWQPAFFWRESILVKSNGIKIKQQKSARTKRRRNSREIEGKKASREAEEGEEKFSMKNHRESERNGARDKTLSYNGWLSGKCFPS